MGSRIKVQLSEERDIPMLVFLWRWKVVTTRVLQAKFFKATALITTYQRLLRLEQAAIIKCVSDDTGSNFYWTLAKKGFAAIRSKLPALCEEGFGVEHVRHDAMVTALHLGEWLIDRPEGVKLMSEQQLRRFASTSLPMWVPSPELHRPDGYWGLPSGNGIIPVALEVELNQKRESAYQVVGDYYREEKAISRVLWMVEAASQARSIQNQIAKSTSIRGDIHSFITLADFKNHQWSSPICCGPDQGKTIREALIQFATSLPPKPILDSPYTFRTQHFLDARKSQARIIS